MKHRLVWAAIFLSLLMLASGCATKVKLIVDPTGQGDYSSIRAAINEFDESVEGQEIIVRPGTYEEQLILRNRVKITGAGRDQVKVVFSKEGPVIACREVQNIAITGMTFDKQQQGRYATMLANRCDIELRNVTFTGSNGIGLDLNNYGRVAMENVTIEGNGKGGLSARTQANVVLKNSIVRNNGLVGISVERFPLGVPPELPQYQEEERSEIVITDTLIEGHKNGCRFDKGAEVLLRNNRILNNATGVEVGEKALVKIEHNVIQGGIIGVLFDTGIDGKPTTDSIALENTIVNMEKFGIKLAARSDPKLWGNIIAKNQNGIFALEGPEPDIQGNYIYDNAKNGIYLKQAGNTKVNRNYIVRNGQVGIVAFWSSPHITRNIIAFNRWHGLFVSDRSKPTVFHNTIWENGKFGVWFTKASEGAVQNNIISRNMLGVSGQKNLGGKPIFTYNSVWGSTMGQDYKAIQPPETDLDEAPMFINEKAYNFRLKPESLLNRGGANNADIGAFGQDLAEDVNPPDAPDYLIQGTIPGYQKPAEPKTPEEPTSIPDDMEEQPEG